MDRDSELIWSNLDRLEYHSWALEEEISADQRNHEGSGSATSKNNEFKPTTTTKSKSKSKCRSKLMINNEKEKAAALLLEEEGASSGLKKLDHNAKERIRRMKLNASFLALRALLPDHSRRSKKKWSAPAVVDRALKYIPEMEKEIEALTCKKESVQSSSSSSSQATTSKKMSTAEEIPTVSWNRVNEEEAIIQVCMRRDDDDEEEESRFTKLLQCVEDEGICSIMSASALDISHTRICYHLHIQTENSTPAASHYFEQLRDKVIYWLQTT